MIVEKIELKLPSYDDAPDVQILNECLKKLQQVTNSLIAINNKETTSVLYAIKDALMLNALFIDGPQEEFDRLNFVLPGNDDNFIVETNEQLKAVLYAFKDVININGLYSDQPQEALELLDSLLSESER